MNIMKKITLEFVLEELADSGLITDDPEIADFEWQYSDLKEAIKVGKGVIDSYITNGGDLVEILAEDGIKHLIESYEDQYLIHPKDSDLGKAISEGHAYLADNDEIVIGSEPSELFDRYYNPDRGMDLFEIVKECLETIPDRRSDTLYNYRTEILNLLTVSYRHLDCDDAEKLLEIIDASFGGSGVCHETSEEGYFVNHYWINTIALYIDMGESDDQTIIYDTDSEEFVCDSIDSWVDEWTEKNLTECPECQNNIPNYDDCPYCGSFHPEDGDYEMKSKNGTIDVGIIGGSFIGTFDDHDKAIAAIGSDMKRREYYPNVWMINDHGNISQIVMDF